MSFKKGDRVKVKWRPRFGLATSTWSAMQPVAGVVVSLKAPGPSSSKIVVKLDDGDYLVQDPSDKDQWAMIEKKETVSMRLRKLGRHWLS